MENLLEFALNIELPASVPPPQWVELVPPGQQVTGRDGRSWLNDQPELIPVAFHKNGCPIPIDYEHSTELKAPSGDEAPAAAWIEDMQVRQGGSIWGKVSWTQRGAESVAAREYRFLSPVLVYDKRTGRIVAISSAGLTNKPNLTLTALNRAGSTGELAADQIRINELVGISREDWLQHSPREENRQALNVQYSAATEQAKINDLLGISSEDWQRYGSCQETDSSLNAQAGISADQARINEMLGVTREDWVRYGPKQESRLAANAQGQADGMSTRDKAKLDWLMGFSQDSSGF